MTNKFKIKCLSLISFFVLITDQVSKNWAYNHIRGEAVKNYLGGVVKIIYAENRGAWGSLGSDLSPVMHFIVLVLVPTVALIAFAIYLFKSKKITYLEIIAYSFILSGGVGNVIDRIVYGYVVDFLYMGYQGLGTNIFNIADVAIMTGVILLFLQFLSQKLSKSPSEEIV